MPVKSHGGALYFMTIVDDFSRKVIVACLKAKSEAAERLTEFIRMAERQTGQKMKTIRTDNGLEYCGTVMFKKSGIKHERSNVETPQMNGVAERVNRTLMDLVRSMLKSSGLPKQFWAEAVTAAAYVRNRVLHSSNNSVPEALWLGKTISVRHLRTYGCLAYAYTTRQGRKKLDERAEPGIMIGYGIRTVGYRIWLPGRNNGIGEVVETKHVKFIENRMGFGTLYKGEDIRHVAPPEWVMTDSDYEDDAAEREPNVGTSVTDAQKSEEFEGPHELQATSEDSEQVKQVRRQPMRRCVKRAKEKEHEANFAAFADPGSVSEALSSPDSTNWKRAKDEEYESLLKRQTWVEVDLPEKAPSIGSKWVFRRKLDSTGSVERYKARLVARGFGQKAGIDYSETNAPVVSLTVIRFLLSLSMQFGWHVRHVDVKSAYLYGKLAEEIYMKLPEGYEHTVGKVARLLRPIYGLKQSGRVWNETLTVFLEKLGFQRQWSSSCVYVSSNQIIIVVYVDDILLFHSDPKEIDKVVQVMKGEYDIHDLGELSFILGVKIHKMKHELRMNQSAYIESILRKFKMELCKPASTPLDPSVELSVADCPKSQAERDEMATVPYREMIGSLVYIALSTFDVTKLSQYNSDPGRVHRNQLKHVLRYLNRTKAYELVFRTNVESAVEIHCDADWVGNVDDRKSWTGVNVKVAGNLVGWMSKKQRCVASSTMEAEYVALAIAVKEAKWLTMMSEELGLKERLKMPVVMLCDSQAAIKFASNRIEKTRTRHIDIAYHVARDAVQSGTVSIAYVPSNQNIADALTKGLRPTAQKNALTLFNIVSQEIGGY
uniref:Integrase catalytic domain-containing protein n=1 Tax=Trichuris muris TaxID=70415 RepID=A0A5S6QJY9_TRIMR